MFHALCPNEHCSLSHHLPPVLLIKFLTSRSALLCCLHYYICSTAAGPVTTQAIPAPWKAGIVHLLGKKKASEDPTVPAHFRPIALTSCISKVFTNLVKKRWLLFMVGNNFLNTATQKAFIVPDCLEHYLKLLTILREAQRRHKSLSICWLDLANAFGSVHHELIAFSLVHHHAPPELIRLVSNIYEGLTAAISTSK